ncbi:MAG: hypothetical protein IJJ26_09750 [Victivallales bacterium]|nr:hypothetical protein [Victivallales bacterium]
MKISSHETDSTMFLELTGTNGRAQVEVPLDGSETVCDVEVLAHRHSRRVPPGKPAVSELAVLGMSLDGIPGKVKTLPLLMPFWE